MPNGLEGLRALICEDEGATLLQLRKALQAAGIAEVAVVTEGERAVSLTSEVKPDFVLMDVNVPGLDGIQATKRIMQAQPTAVIMLTAYGDADSVEKALDAGACAYLVKPVTSKQLVPAVKAALGRYEALKAAKGKNRALKEEFKEAARQEVAAMKEALRTDTVKAALKSGPGDGAKEPNGAAQKGGSMTTEQELLELTHRLLESIHQGDIETYRRLCTDDLTCYETDVAPYRIDGIDFHTDLMTSMKAQNAFANLTRFDMLTPKVQLYGDAAVVTYTRLMTYAGTTPPVWRTFNETRVFVRLGGEWKMVHFHRSEAG